MRSMRGTPGPLGATRSQRDVPSVLCWISGGAFIHRIETGVAQLVEAGQTLRTASMGHRLTSLGGRPIVLHPRGEIPRLQRAPGSSRVRVGQPCV
jgi:hypothetical protein